MTTFVNCTPHEVRVFGSAADESPALVLPKGQTVPRVSMVATPVQVDAPFPVVQNVPGPTVDLPAPSHGVFLVVSALVRSANPDRLDLASPGELKRNAEGQPVGCVGLVMN